MKTTREEYMTAKKLVSDYESCRYAEFVIKREAFRKDLEVMFLTNDKLTIKEFKLDFDENYITPINPNLFDAYSGELDGEIAMLGKKHGVTYVMHEWAYCDR